MCSLHPNDKIIDIEEINKKVEKHLSTEYPKPNKSDVIKYQPMIDKILSYNTSFQELKREFKYSHKLSYLYTIFLKIYHSDDNVYTPENLETIRNALKIKNGKSHSGIISVTIFTAAYPEYIDIDGNTVKQDFSCAFNCSFCPSEPGQSKSYLSLEPGVLRANRVNFDCVRQMHVRMEALYLTGHDIDKLEVLVLGGTWTSYPLQYREQFITNMYYAANTFPEYIANVITGQNKVIRKAFSLRIEKEVNTYAKCRVIGLTLETRPDTINPQEIARFRSYGCTRLQLGIQHIDNDILDRINRKCTTETTIKAIEMLKNCGYKIDAHFMPNLPNSNVKKDEDMFDDLLGVYSKKYINENDEKWELKHPELQVDQLKIYPTTITPYTEIEKWYKEGTYIPYSNEVLYDLLYKVKSLIFPWIRLNRCIRDIPSDYVPQEDYNSNMRQEIEAEMIKSGIRCQCIRCREVKNMITKEEPIIVVREYNASNDREFFISCESPDKKILYGFVRLRLVRKQNQCYYVFPELRDAALIRELHVYSNMQSVGTNGEKSHQHTGIGKRLMAKAEEVAKLNGFTKISVISGQGVKGYYAKLGYVNDKGAGDFMIKNDL
jgi:ELP3 family radical SAM enzyme/protein acetyltransferase